MLMKPIRKVKKTAPQTSQRTTIGICLLSSEVLSQKKASQNKTLPSTQPRVFRRRRRNHRMRSFPLAPRPQIHRIRVPTIGLFFDNFFGRCLVRVAVVKLLCWNSMPDRFPLPPLLRWAHCPWARAGTDVAKRRQASKSRHEAVFSELVPLGLMGQVAGLLQHQPFRIQDSRRPAGQMPFFIEVSVSESSFGRSTVSATSS